MARFGSMETKPVRTGPARVLWLGDGGCNTGFGTVTHQIGERLVRDYDHDVHVLATNFRGDSWPSILDRSKPTNLRLYRPTTFDLNDLYGRTRIVELLGKVEPDVVVMLNDPKIILEFLFNNPHDTVPTADGEAKHLLLRYRPILSYVPCDGTNLPPKWTEVLPKVTRMLTYSKWGQKVYGTPDYTPEMVYHGVDTDTFHPVSADNPIHIEGTDQVVTTKRECKRLFRFDPDGFLVLRVDANSGRKDYPASYKALVPFMDNHRDVQVHFHGAATNSQSGVDLAALWSRTPQFKAGERWFVPGLHEGREGWPPSHLAALYNAADVFLSTSRGEGFGLCVDPETPISVAGGSKHMRQVQVGDEVLTRDGYRSVQGKIERIADDRLEVDVFGVPNVTVTPEHPFYALRGHASRLREHTVGVEPLWVRADALKHGDYVGTPRPKWDAPLPDRIDILDLIGTEGVEFSDEHVWMPMGYSPKGAGRPSLTDVQREFGVSKRVAEDAFRYAATGLNRGLTVKPDAVYRKVATALIERSVEVPTQLRINRFVPVNADFLSLVGWYLAEGSASGGRGIELDLGLGELPIVNSLAEKIERLFGVKAIVGTLPNKHVARVHASSKILSRLFVALCGKGAKNKRLHPMFVRSAKSIGPLVGAYVRGDGHATEGGYSVTTASEQLAWQLREVAAVIGVPLNVMRTTRFNDFTPLGGTIYALSTQGENGATFAKWTGLPIPRRRTRKPGQHYIITDDFIYSRVRGTKSVGPGEVMDISVAGTHEFVGGGLLLHNTIAESLACGVPVIAQNVSAIPEVVGPGGILIEPDRLITVPAGEDTWLADIPAFTKALEKMYRSKGLRRDLGNAGRAHVVQSFSWDVAAAAFHNNIEALAAVTSPRDPSEIDLPDG